ncbi:MAG: bifunctional folylpolyglutamate synthase/dihydrofolate synthase [Verrucomicrobiae bacterium]|nr:bifunctional folylpolyglutamate synthase/dihydrofolate synthase [Verrucomicrobiae bacterium]NNJ86910.1 bifunctional folylpolyglutamate synthase/dihydrofolate synthase [Akkermansiaceae bacterium]
MTYQEAIDWLYSTQQFGIKLGLVQPRRLLRETLAFPKPGVKVIHVAGTNGKGSTCAIIDALARACGTKCGLFTSPHLIDYRERVRVNGKEISEATTAQFLTEIREHVANWEHHPTFFEITLALGMRHFREQNCELIVLETGMGGRLDATTAVPADLAVITPIAMDHSQWLGDTLHEIAAEKAGIIVPQKPVLSSRQQPEAHTVIEEHANELISPIEFITTPLTGYSINLPGRHQRDNAALALAAAHQIGLPLNSDIVRAALNKVSWPGRFEKLQIPNSKTQLILDAAHNPHAAETLVSTWKEEYPDKKATIIFGAVEGKNTDKVLAILSEIAAHIHLTSIDSPRSLTAADYKSALPNNIPHTLHHDLSQLIQHSLFNIQHSQAELVLVCGSIFLIGQAKALLTGTSTRTSNQ